MTIQKTEPPPSLPEKPALYVDSSAGDKPALMFDVEYFDKILNRPDIPQEERHAALNDFWHLIAMFIDVGWGVYPMPENGKQDSGGQTRQTAQESAVFGSDMLYSDKALLLDTFIETSGLTDALKGDQNE